MDWDLIAQNQGVSYNTLRDAVSKNVFVQLNPIPLGRKQLTKAQAIFYVCLRTTAFPLVNKTNNQVVVKRDLLPCETPVIKTFRVLNNNSLPITVELALNGTQVIPSQVCAPNSVTTLTPTVDVTHQTAAFMEYGVSGYTPGSASLFVFPTGYTPDSVGSIIQITNVDLTPASSDIELTINP